MTVKEKLEDVSWKYLFVNSWTWHDATLSEDYNGHPHAGEVYRAIYNDKTKNYKLEFPTEQLLTDVLLIEKLTFSDDDSSGSLTEITKENIVKLNLSEADLDKLIGWFDNAKQDMAKLYGKKKAPERITVVEPSNQERQVMAGALHILNSIYQTNTALFALIMEVASRLHRNDMQKPIHNAMTTLTLSGGASGVNIHQALGNLEEYIKPIKKGGDDRDNVIYAIIHLFTELQRRVINNLDD